MPPGVWQPNPGLNMKRYRERQARLKVHDGMNPDAAKLASEWGKYAPTLPKQALMSFVAAGIAPNSALGQWAMQIAVPAFRQQDTNVERDQALEDAIKRHDDMAIAEITNELVSAEAFTSESGTAVAPGGGAVGFRSVNPIIELATSPGRLAELQKLSIEEQTPILTTMTQRPEMISNLTPAQFSTLLDTGKMPDNSTLFVKKVVKPASRVGFAGLQAGYEGVQSAIRARSALGSSANPTATAAGASPGVYIGDAKAKSDVRAKVEGTNFGKTVTTPGGGKITYGSPAEVADIAGQTTLGQMLTGKDAGQGFFPAGEAHEAQARAARDAAAIDGHALTPGRAYASLVTEPGTTPYNILSGTVDAAVAIKADPANLLLDSLSEANKARRLFSVTTEDALATTADNIVDAIGPENAKVIQDWAGVEKNYGGAIARRAASNNIKEQIVKKLADDPGSLQDLVDAGVITHKQVAAAIGRKSAGAVKGQRAFVNGQSALQWFNDPKTGGRVIEDMAGKTGVEIYLDSGTKIPATVAWELGKAQTPAEVRTILGSHVMGGELREIPKATHGLGSLRWAGHMPGEIVDLFDNDQLVQEGLDILKAFKIPRTEWDGFLRPLAESSNRPQALKGMERVANRVADRILDKDAEYQKLLPEWERVKAAYQQTDVVTPEYTRIKANVEHRRAMARKLTNYYYDETNEQHKWWVDSLGETPYVRGLSLDGEAVAIEGPYAPSELLNRTIPAIGGRGREGVREIQRAVSWMSPLWNNPKTGPAMRELSYLWDNVMFAWKGSKLLRLALPIFSIADETARQVVAGHETFFNDPISAIAWVTGKKGNQDLTGVDWTMLLRDYKSEVTRALGTTGRFREELGASDAILGKQWGSFSRDHPQYIPAWYDRLSSAHIDPVGGEVARAIIGGEPAGTSYDVVRFERGGVSLAEAAERPMGAYTIPRGRENPHGGMPGEVEIAGRVTPRRPLDVSGASGTLGLDAAEGAGTLALKVLLPDNEFQRVIRLSADELEAEVATRFGITDANGRGELLDIYGAQEARRAGHDALIYNAPDTNFDEVVVLSPSIVDSGELSPLEFVKQAFWDGDLADERQLLIDANTRWGSANLVNRAQADAYVDGWVQRLDDLSMGDADIMEALADGHPFGPGGSTAFKHHLRQMLRDGNSPMEVIGQVPVSSQQRSGLMRRATNAMFSVLMDLPSATLNRNQAFRQEYYKFAEELLPYLDDAGRAQMIEQAAADGVKLVAGPEAVGSPLTVEHVDKFAKARALKANHDFLYFPGDRTATEDKIRNIIPFASAWRDAIKTWSKLVVQNPRTIRRFQQGVTAARESGWWYFDERQNKEVFTVVPGGVNEKLFGAPFPTTSPVSGFNMVTGLPGFGPALTYPASMILKGYDVPLEDELRKVILPYGDPEGVEPGGGLMDEFFPGWLQKVRASGYASHIPFTSVPIPFMQPTAQDERALEQASMDAFKYVMSSGEYDQDDPEDLWRAEKKAQSIARKMFLWRGLAAFSVRGGPKIDPRIELKDGSIVETALLADDYQKMLVENDGDTYAATLQFVNKYGHERIFATQGKNRKVVFGLPTTIEASVWTKAHPEFAAKFPQIFGYWAPQSGDFSIDAYFDEVARGIRKPLKLSEWRQIAEARLGQAIYDQLRQRVGPNISDPERAWLNDNKKKIAEQYPGFDQDWLKIPRNTLEQEIPNIRRAVRDPLVKDSPLSHAVTVYLDLRDRAIAALKKQGVTLAAEQAAAQWRTWLYENGSQIAAQMPEFQTMWDDLFSQEVEPK